MKWIKCSDRLPEFTKDFQGNKASDNVLIQIAGEYHSAYLEAVRPEFKKLIWMPTVGNDCFDIEEYFGEKVKYWKPFYSPSQTKGEEEKVFTLDKPKVICLCGSTRFAEYFMIKRWELEKKGIITFGINILPDNYFAEGNSHGAEQEGVKEILDELHKRKIDLSDEVFILNVNGYIGESTRNEINYAQSKNKLIKYLEPIDNPDKGIGYSHNEGWDLMDMH